MQEPIIAFDDGLLIEFSKRSTANLQITLFLHTAQPGSGLSR